MSARRLALAGLVSACALACVLVLGSASAVAGKGYLPGPGVLFGSEGSGDGQFIEPAGVAVNDSSEPLVEPAAGDVYVVDRGNNRVERFGSTGVYVSQWDGSATPAGSFSGPEEIAVDDSGSLADPSLWDVYVGDSGHNVVDRFSATGEYLGQLTGTCAVGPCTGEEAFEELHGVAVDPSGNLWVYQGPGAGNVDEFSSSGSFLKTFNTGRGAQPGMAVDSTGDVYVISGSGYVLRFDSGTGGQLAEFDPGASGLAVDLVTGNLLVDREAGIDLFASAPQSSSTPLETFPGEGLADSHGIAVNGAGTVYASERTADSVEFFNAVLFPGLSMGTPSQVSETSETLHGTVNPEGEAVVACRFEYAVFGTEAGVYPRTVACKQSPSEIGTGTSGVPVSADVSGLQPGATYRVRLTAADANGVAHSGEATFAVHAEGTPASGLPDGRAYELVSALGNGEVYVPENNFAGLEDILTPEPVRAAAGGDALAYAGDPPGSGVGGNGFQGNGIFANEYLAKRTSAGWTASDIEPPLSPTGRPNPAYQAFSDDLSLAFFNSPDQPPLSGAPVCHEEESSALYSRDSEGGFGSLFTTTLTPGLCGRPLFAGVSADGTHSVFQTEAPLISPAVTATGSGSGRELCGFDCNLYESVGGRLSLVNILPGGGVDSNATFGGLSHSPEEGNAPSPDFSNVISADGSRAVWTDVSTSVVYMRVDGVRTVRVSAGAARFWTASVDDRFVFYTEGESLVRFDVTTGAREELAGAGAGVQGVVGASDDGSYVYFVADGALAPGAVPHTCASETGDEGCNLYVLHLGEAPRYVATLSPKDNENAVTSSSASKTGDWIPDLGSRMAEVSADGRGVVFNSTRPLTGYDNVSPSDPQHGAIPEMFVYEYDAEGGRLFCASCDPSGAPPTYDLVQIQASTYFAGGIVSPSNRRAYMFRWISDDGARVFFDTAQPLVRSDINGRVDVYEWERQGTGSCGQAHGCVYLISSGAGGDQSFLVDASASGDDVFFVTRAQLVPEDRDGSFAVYDARIGGGFTRVGAPVCTGAGCQGVPAAPPPFATPASATFSGVGNLAPPPVVKAKPRRKPKVTACKRGFARRHGRCVRAKGRGANAHGRHAKKGRKS